MWIGAGAIDVGNMQTGDVMAFVTYSMAIVSSFMTAHKNAKLRAEQGGDLEIGIDKYFMYDGFSYRFTPIRNDIEAFKLGVVDTDELYVSIQSETEKDTRTQIHIIPHIQNPEIIGRIKLRSYDKKYQFGFKVE